LRDGLDRPPRQPTRPHYDRCAALFHRLSLPGALLAASFASRYMSSACAIAVRLVGYALRFPANVRKSFSASARYLSSPVLAHSRTRLRTATLLPDGCAPSYWSLLRANSFSWSLAVKK